LIEAAPDHAALVYNCTIVPDTLKRYRQLGSEAWLLLPESGAQDYGIQAISFYVTKGLMAKVKGHAMR
jgi:hypothetical protein